MLPRRQLVMARSSHRDTTPVFQALIAQRTRSQGTIRQSRTLTPHRRLRDTRLPRPLRGMIRWPPGNMRLPYQGRMPPEILCRGIGRRCHRRDIVRQPRGNTVPRCQRATRRLCRRQVMTHRSQASTAHHSRVLTPQHSQVAVIALRTRPSTLLRCRQHMIRPCQPVGTMPYSRHRIAPPSQISTSRASPIRAMTRPQRRTTLLPPLMVTTLSFL